MLTWSISVPCLPDTVLTGHPASFDLKANYAFSWDDCHEVNFAVRSRRPAGQIQGMQYSPFLSSGISFKKTKNAPFSIANGSFVDLGWNHPSHNLLSWLYLMHPLYPFNPRNLPPTGAQLRKVLMDLAVHEAKGLQLNSSGCIRAIYFLSHGCPLLIPGPPYQIFLWSPRFP